MSEVEALCTICHQTLLHYSVPVVTCCGPPLAQVSSTQQCVGCEREGVCVSVGGSVCVSVGEGVCGL